MDPQVDAGLPTLLAVAIIAVLLLISAFFSAAEISLASCSRARLHALALDGDRRAKSALVLRERQEQVVSALALGSNLLNVVSASIATGLAIDWFGPAGLFYAAALMTILIVVFCEALPKTLALNCADRLILAVAPMLGTTETVLIPIDRAIHEIARLLLRPFGAHRPARSREGSVEELRGAIELATNAKEEKTERAMLRSILDLTNVTVGEIMIHRRNVFSIDIEQRPGLILEQVLAGPHTRVPLWRGQAENVIGVLHARDLLHALRINRVNPDAINIIEIARRPWFIPESTTLLDQLEAFRRRHEHFALVVDEYGALLGVVTLTDILEEIVGGIADRPPHNVPGVRTEPDGSYIVDGHVTIRDLNREYDWSLPDQEAATIAGLVLAEARRIPEIGQIFTFHGFRFEILRRRRNQLTGIRITPTIKRSPAEAG
jgi:Mg2+/Co2+ transporter CorB